MSDELPVFAEHGGIWSAKSHCEAGWKGIRNITGENWSWPVFRLCFFVLRYAADKGALVSGKEALGAVGKGYAVLSQDAAAV